MTPRAHTAEVLRLPLAGDDEDEPSTAFEWDEPAAEVSAASPVPAAETTVTLGLALQADEPTLAGWMRRIVERDERALEALYDATAARVLALARRLTCNDSMSEEVVEDTFWQVWRQAPRFDPARGKVLTWLLAIARSRAIDALRRDQRFAHDELPDDDLAEDPHEDGPEARLQAGRDAQALGAALARLDVRSRQVVSMAFLRGLTHEEIATQAALPLGTVKSLIRRALIQVRQTLEDGHARP